MKKPENPLPQFLKEARQECGLTQRQVAESLGYSTPQFISAWERGDREPPMNAIHRLAELLKVKAEDIFDLMLKYRMVTMETEMRAEFSAEAPQKKTR